MYLSRLTIRNFRLFGDGEAALDLALGSGVTALVGRNDCGKSAVIDAVRYALLTRDQSYIRIQPEDFHIDADGKQATEISIRCQLSGLGDDDKGAFAEYLSYDADGDVTLFINWTARKRSDSPTARRWVEVSVRSGMDATGPSLEPEVRDLLSSTYLRPLRDAAREMSPGRGSRLSQILASVPDISKGAAFDQTSPPPDAATVAQLSLLGLADYLSYHVKNHAGVSGAEKAINSQYLSSLVLRGEGLRGKIDVTDGGSESVRLRQILERLQLGLLEKDTAAARGSYGLGSNNLLYMACELLLLGREPDGLPLLLIEEPEAHLHPQRQLRLMEFLSRASAGEIKESKRSVQVLLSTHSPNLASVIPLKNIVLLDAGRGFSLAPTETKLNASDYSFLERFLDVTKANLFFAHGVIVVEGSAEAILLPTLARLIGADLTEHGVSIVNVGGTGLRRFSRIFQRSADVSATVSVPVACVTDMDVLPDCAPAILGRVAGEEDEKWSSPQRRWKALRDFGNNEVSRAAALANHRADLRSDDGQSVRTFIAEQWTLEYDLAYCGLAREVHTAAHLAKADELLNAQKKQREDAEAEAQVEFERLLKEVGEDREALSSHVYGLFESGGASKAIAAQYLAGILSKAGELDGFDHAEFASRLPSYLVAAIKYACRADRLPVRPPGLSKVSSDV